MGLGSEFTFPLLVTISSSPSRGLMESYCYDSAVGGRWQAVVFDHGLVAAVEGASYGRPSHSPQPAGWRPPGPHVCFYQSSTVTLNHSEIHYYLPGQPVEGPRS